MNKFPKGSEADTLLRLLNSFKSHGSIWRAFKDEDGDILLGYEGTPWKVIVKELLSVTDGNLASHLKSLEKSGYIVFQKKFLGRKPNTKYSATEEGQKAFVKHIKAIEKLLK